MPARGHAIPGSRAATAVAPRGHCSRVCRRCWPTAQRLSRCLSRLLRQAHEELKARFLAEEPVEDLVHARAALIDIVLREAVAQPTSSPTPMPGRWSRSAAMAAASCIPAPTSTSWCWCRSRPTPTAAASVERLVTFFWDIGLEVGHSVRTVEECVQESCRRRKRHDDAARSPPASLATAALLDRMRTALAPEHVWPVKEFFEAKVREQSATGT